MSSYWSTETGLAQLTTASGSELRSEQALYAGDALTSPNGRYRLAYQADGNLVLYGPSGASAWSSGTSGQPAGLCTIDSDGNLTIYGPGMRVLWSKPHGERRVNARLVVQNDGDVVLLGDPVPEQQ
ncbi:D-mannose binding lectin [Kribbella amoyensis]|uniref:D-mannose binding lectin n=1 Tax=Kribbella amoyensis TaxID=996641 RepID=A0A561BV16_9ACTN|nr:lectin [Kribbella amoyensis]TWD82643.1 D-mannose binding lectin [Kribbella amoyensis]